MIIPRQIGTKILELSRVYPIISITGPRQSGKTTLAKALFSSYAYANLENPDTRLAIEEDPRRFLLGHSKAGLIVDEAQKVPAVFSYLQQIVDESHEMGKFILTGSQHFLLLEKITQSLAGRVAVCHLFPFDQSELRAGNHLADQLDQALLQGAYPALYDRGILPSDYFPSYIETYVERDVRSILNIVHLNLFERFLKLCAGRVGQLLNASSLGNDLGVNYKTVQSWLSILEASFIVFSLSPHHVNYNKRVIKQPKLYFYDTGLLCSLLGIHTKEQLDSHYLRGSIFESYVIAEYMKNRRHQGLPSNAYFWRDNKGNEIDLLLEEANCVKAIEIKAGETISDDFFKGLKYFKELSAQSDDCFYLIYGGKKAQDRKHGKVLGWTEIAKISVTS